MKPDTIIKFLLLAYIPNKVIVKRTDPDGRSWVYARGSTPTNEFWVGTAQLYDTKEECIKGNAKVIADGIKQVAYEMEQKAKQLREMEKLIQSVT